MMAWRVVDSVFKLPMIALLPAVFARSKATKQSILSLRGQMDCFASLAMTANADTTSRSRGAIRPSFARTFRP
jgi:hypothetical protein